MTYIVFLWTLTIENSLNKKLVEKILIFTNHIHDHSLNTSCDYVMSLYIVGGRVLILNLNTRI